MTADTGTTADGAFSALEVLEDPQRAELSVIWLHGMGQGPGHVKAVAQRLALPQAGVRGVFPSAPVTLVSGVTGRPATSWFVQRVGTSMRADPSSVSETDRWLRPLIDAEVERFGERRVALAGFSQGAVMALYSGLRYPVPLAGIAVYAAFEPADVDLLDSVNPATAALPVWMGHGVRDWVVPYTSGKEVRQALIDRGHPVTWRWYQGGHVTFGEVSTELADFFRELRG